MTTSRLSNARLCPYCADVHQAIEACPFRAVMEDTLDRITEVALAESEDLGRRFDVAFPDPEVVEDLMAGETWTPYDDQDLLQALDPVPLSQRGVTLRWVPLGVPQVYEGDQA